MIARTMLTEPRRDLALWSGWLAPPVSWFAHAVLVYALADGACHGGSLLPLHLVTAAGLALAALGGFLARAGRRRPSASPVDDRRASREGFLETQAVWSARLFSAVIVVQWVVVFVLDPCPL